MANEMRGCSNATRQGSRASPRCHGILPMGIETSVTHTQHAHDISSTLSLAIPSSEHLVGRCSLSLMSLESNQAHHTSKTPPATQSSFSTYSFKLVNFTSIPIFSKSAFINVSPPNASSGNSELNAYISPISLPKPPGKYSSISCTVVSF
jgi:hypothetical protein